MLILHQRRLYLLNHFFYMSLIQIHFQVPFRNLTVSILYPQRKLLLRPSVYWRNTWNFWRHLMHLRQNALQSMLRLRLCDSVLILINNCWDYVFVPNAWWHTTERIRSFAVDDPEIILLKQSFNMLNFRIVDLLLLSWRLYLIVTFHTAWLLPMIYWF